MTLYEIISLSIALGMLIVAILVYIDRRNKK